jgi:hypothetical protein
LFISVFGHAQKHEWGLRTSIGQSRLTDSINGFGEENSFYFGAGISYNFSLNNFNSSFTYSYFRTQIPTGLPQSTNRYNIIHIEAEFGHDFGNGNLILQPNVSVGYGRDGVLIFFSRRSFDFAPGIKLIKQKLHWYLKYRVFPLSLTNLTWTTEGDNPVGSLSMFETGLAYFLFGKSEKGIIK